MARFDGVIPPGGEGTITLVVKTKGIYGGLAKRARVYSNSPDNPVEILTVIARVIAPVEISSRYVYFRGFAGNSATRLVTVKSNLDGPIRLEPTQFDLPEKISYEITEVEKGKLFRIRFTSIPGPAETYEGLIKFKTNHAQVPEITIYLKGIFK